MLSIDPLPRPGGSGEFSRPKNGEDWLAVTLGVSLFLLSLFGFSGFEIFGWAIKTNVRTRASETMTPVSRNFPTSTASRTTLHLSRPGHLDSDCQIASDSAIEPIRFCIQPHLSDRVWTLCDWPVCLSRSNTIRAKEIHIPWSMNRRARWRLS